MGLIGIGEAARILGLNTSALRYSDERGLLRPATRRAGKRMYDTAQLRHSLLIQMMQRLGIPLDSAAAIMDEPSDAWRDSLAHQVEQLDDLIARATLAREFLTHATRCPPTIRSTSARRSSPHSTGDCQASASNSSCRNTAPPASLRASPRACLRSGTRTSAGLGGVHRKAEEELVAVFYVRRRQRSGGPAEARRARVGLGDMP